MRIARDGWKFVLPFLATSVSSFFLWKIVGFVFLALSCLTIYFFRDPERNIPEGEDIIVSPADGRIVDIASSEKGSFSDYMIVRIFMSLFDVHVQRSPVKGRVSMIQYTRGRFLPAYRKEAFEKNESNLIRIKADCDLVDILVKQVAGSIARRISCWCKEGQGLRVGERLGMIRFGSRVDLYIPREVELLVRNGDKVTAGETLIGRLKPRG